MKDYFSGHAKLYATFRPDYPVELYRFIFDHLHGKKMAWDCATGNGQVARYLSQHFDEVYATDISQQQLNNAHTAPNIKYSISAAEKTSFSSNQFDLITVAQALHWFNLDEFFGEALRVAKDKALLATWGYSLCTVNAPIDVIIQDFYTTIVGPYWDSARKLVDAEYTSIPFPFEYIPSPKFSIQQEWTREQFVGYLTTWSSTQKYITIHQTNPVLLVAEKLTHLWKSTEKKIVNFPVFLRLGIIHK